MRRHIEATIELLASLDWPVYYVDVPATPPPAYVLLWSAIPLPDDEQPMSGPAPMVTALGVTSVAATALGVLDVRTAVHNLLDGGTPAVEGRSVTLTHRDSQVTDTDDSVNPPKPFGVDLYDLTSVPA